MFLAIDIGNTNIVFGVHNYKNWVKDWRIQTDPLKTADEYEVIFRALFTSGKVAPEEIKSIVMSCVVPSLLQPFEEMIEELFGVEPTIVGPEIYPKLPLKILNPYQIGADLVANAIAAFMKFGGYITVIDFGTALTFTTIGKNGEILGVAIAPGLRTAVTALAGKTAQLPHVHLAPPPSVLGENTIHAIQAGIVLGYTGLVDSIITRTEKELNQHLKIVATGGLSPVISRVLNRIDAIEPMLTLDGLMYIGKYTS
jgi:type III pantothenate kinase